MAQLSVATLHLRGPPATAARATWRAEEALRLSAPEGERLLVLRRLSLGRLSVRGAVAPWQGRAETALREAATRAVHASSPGAAMAEAVWFASVAEARWLLLRELAVGRRPEAWFWRLAVPDWRGMTLSAWLPLVVAEAVREPAQEVALALAVLRLTEEGALPTVMRALPFAPAAPMLAREAMVAERPDEVRIAAQVLSDAPRILQRILPRLRETPRRRVLDALRSAPTRGTAARWLVRLTLLAAAPELAAQPELLAAMVDTVLQEPSLLLVPTAPRAPKAWRPEPAKARAAEHRADPLTQPPASRPTPHARGASQSSDAEARDAAPAPRVPVDAPSPPVVLPEREEEWRSRAAGVLLLVRPLARMGLPDWLDRHPELAATGFARALLRHVALRVRTPPDDAVFRVLGEVAQQPDDLLDAWRVGLDRWLRRRVRRRLSDLAPRGGWLRPADESLAVRFRADAADVRLRRLALDVDPGWVPWLGLSIRYHFRDAPPP